MATKFTKLNDGWNADPNAPDPRISTDKSDVILEFSLNPVAYPQYEKSEQGILRFSDCWRYCLGPTNDEGWHRGQCRFSRLAPQWGEFYEVTGDLLLETALDPNNFYSEKFNMQLAPYSL